MNLNRDDNPYTYLLYDAMSRRGDVEISEFSVGAAIKGRYDVLHVHWPEGLLNKGGVARQIASAVALGLLLAWVRVSNHGVVWTVHNFRPHRVNASRAARAIVSIALAQTVSGLIYLSDESRAQHRQMHRWVSRRSSVVIPIGTLVSEYVPSETREGVRGQLGVGEDVCLFAFVGRMEPYKGAHKLLELFVSRDLGSDAALLLAGRIPPGQYGEDLRAQARHAGAIMEDGWLSNSRMAELLSAADVAVYPYERILNSASVFLPIEFGTVVVAPAAGSIPEMSRAIGGGWLRTYSGDLTEEALTSARVAGRPEEPPRTESFRWPALADATTDFLRTLSSRRTG
jgi:glycosyltransferase involved in cell wall biosynthesis